MITIFSLPHSANSIRDKVKARQEQRLALHCTYICIRVTAVFTGIAERKLQCRRFQITRPKKRPEWR